jgi:putative transposase
VLSDNYVGRWATTIVAGGEGRREEMVEPTSSAERAELIKLRRKVRQLRLERSEALLRTLMADGSVGDAYDNAVCESFFSMLECELLSRRKFASGRSQDRRLQLHRRLLQSATLPSAIGYQSPIHYESNHT